MSTVYLPSKDTVAKIKRLLGKPMDSLSIAPTGEGSEYFWRWVKVGSLISSSPNKYHCVTTVFDPVTTSWTDGAETSMRLIAEDGGAISSNHVPAQLWGYDDDSLAWYVCGATPTIGYTGTYTLTANITLTTCSMIQTVGTLHISNGLITSVT